MTHRDHHGHPALKLAFAMLLSGTIGVFVMQSGLDPINVVFWRCVFGTAFMGAWCLFRGYFRGLAWRGVRMAIVCGVLVVLNWITLFTAYRLTSIATATIVYNASPFFVVLAGRLFLSEAITRDQMVWMLAAFGGVVLASGLLSSGEHGEAGWAAGTAITLVAAMLYAMTTLISKGMGHQRPEITVFWQTATGIVLLAPLADLSHPVPAAASWGWLLGLGAVHTGLCYVLMYASYPRLTTSTIGTLSFIYPLVAIVSDWMVYGHRLTVAQITGALVIAVATLGSRLGWRVGWPRGYSRAG
ncbi:DMT family transporter [Gluconacetobacter azotocaptans]|uniref:DMT family transporter n=1 Tax=Gluconacetobacter azotocaptans TaxID=142834 RepID=A0A7W4JPP6_9PROT|nr:DMT family transporter [Gluconacetobacter azotocaptans]MBB2188631.1 DMT family transporter [Gluconacetobacter azotocaptans]MBM9400335.1 DMT family transporter [Gluconacetobacter azotocaptans]GBQ35289.1 drug/metabolite transporter superfamily permease [Gluconacetobacter azotocaptans DSM 13594]